MGSNLLNWSNYYEMIVVGPLPFCNKDEWGVVAVILDNNCQVSDGISAEYFKGFVSFPKSQLCEVVCLYWNVIPHLVQIPSLVNRVQHCRPAWFFILNPKTSETWGMCSGQCWQCCTEKCTKLTWMKRCLLSMKLAAKSRFFNKVFYFLLKFLQIKRQWSEPRELAVITCDQAAGAPQPSALSNQAGC